MTSVLLKRLNGYFVRVPPKRKPYWYKKVGLKHVTGFLSIKDKRRLQKLADADDKSLVLYVTRVLERHLAENDPPSPEQT